MLAIALATLLLNQLPRRWTPNGESKPIRTLISVFSGKMIAFFAIFVLFISIVPFSLRTSQILDEPFSVSGKVRCDGGGLFGKGESRSRTLSYTAPSGMQIVDYGTKTIRIQYGSTGDTSEIRDEDGHLRTISVAISCDAPDKIGGKGGWNDTDLIGRTRPTWL